MFPFDEFLFEDAPDFWESINYSRQKCKYTQKKEGSLELGKDEQEINLTIEKV